MLFIKSAKNKALNFFLNLINFLPTRRPQDEIIKGQGTIVKIEGNILRADGAQFTKTAGEKYTIGLTVQKKNFIVTKVIDNCTLQIENPENYTLDGASEEYTILPKIDHKVTFGAAWKLLEEGQVVGIFPEVFLLLI